MSGIFSPVVPEDLLEARQLARKFVRQVRHQFRAERAVLLLLNPNLGELEVEAAMGLSASCRRRRWVLGQGLVGWVASRGMAARADVKGARHAL
ncbi:MAG: hypothetical protein EBT50_07710, partial [Verrucomicrobia bacterium]|nr:hypothetical protein [Verrucomicrobiota bacterium]